MLEELKNKFYSGTKGDLLYFLSEVIGKKSLSVGTIMKACEYSPQIPLQNIDALICLSLYMKFIGKEKDKIFLSKDLQTVLTNKKEVSHKITSDIFNALMTLTPKVDLFSYDLIKGMYKVKHEFIPNGLSIFRDVLTNLSVFKVVRTDSKSTFYLSHEYEDLLQNVSSKTQRKKSLDHLIHDLEKKAEFGKAAELFVMEFELKRLKTKKPKRISEADVSAGFDILSFETDKSERFDRFIEVKAIGKDISFYWTKNEKSKATLWGKQYYLYLVDLNQVKGNHKYEPTIIQDPANAINPSNWVIETETYFISKLN